MDYRYQKHVSDHSKTLTILHFGDIYELLPHSSHDQIAKGKTLGGAARFATLLKQFTSLNPIITFAGDWLAPSLLSSLTQGLHNSEILEQMGVHFGTFGNHDLDFHLGWLEKACS